MGLARERRQEMPAENGVWVPVDSPIERIRPYQLKKYLARRLATIRLQTCIGGPPMNHIPSLDLGRMMAH